MRSLTRSESDDVDGASDDNIDAGPADRGAGEGSHPSVLQAPCCAICKNPASIVARRMYGLDMDVPCYNAAKARSRAIGGNRRQLDKDKENARCDVASYADAVLKFQDNSTAARKQAIAQLQMEMRAFEENFKEDRNFTKKQKLDLNKTQFIAFRCMWDRRKTESEASSEFEHLADEQGDDWHSGDEVLVSVPDITRRGCVESDVNRVGERREEGPRPAAMAVVKARSSGADARPARGRSHERRRHRRPSRDRGHRSRSRTRAARSDSCSPRGRRSNDLREGRKRCELKRTSSMLSAKAECSTSRARSPVANPRRRGKRESQAPCKDLKEKELLIEHARQLALRLKNDAKSKGKRGLLEQLQYAATDVRKRGENEEDLPVNTADLEREVAYLHARAVQLRADADSCLVTNIGEIKCHVTDVAEKCAHLEERVNTHIGNLKFKEKQGVSKHRSTYQSKRWKVLRVENAITQRKLDRSTSKALALRIARLEEEPDAIAYVEKGDVEALYEMKIDPTELDCTQVTLLTKEYKAFQAVCDEVADLETTEPYKKNVDKLESWMKKKPRREELVRQLADGDASRHQTW